MCLRSDGPASQVQSTQIPLMGVVNAIDIVQIFKLNQTNLLVIIVLYINYPPSM